VEFLYEAKSLSKIAKKSKQNDAKRSEKNDVFVSQKQAKMKIGFVSLHFASKQKFKKSEKGTP
jgi:hypothetical protein